MKRIINIFGFVFNMFAESVVIVGAAGIVLQGIKWLLAINIFTFIAAIVFAFVLICIREYRRKKPW